MSDRVESAESARRSLTIDVVSDVVCPWCYVGKRRLAAALATLAGREPQTRVDVRWHPFQLNPELPRGGIDRAAYLAAKFGSETYPADTRARLAAAAATVGLALDFDRIARQPNTEDAHRLVAWSQEIDAARTDDLVERLFRAFFVEGRDVGDRAELVAIAGEAGCDPAAASAMLGSDRYADAVADSDRRARELGIGGVPFFIFDGKVAVSGAHEPATLQDAIAQARAR
jgi:predicted DsbA family dithiol-disulfide isomerase